jgi:hypothetical protein
MRASGNADLLAGRGRGMSDREAAETLRKLDRALPDLDVSVPSLIASMLRLHPEWSDADVVRRIRGLDDPAEVARVRAQIAAGREPTAPAPSEPSEEGPMAETTTAPKGKPPPAAKAPPVAPKAKPGGPVDLAAFMPTYLVISPSGTATVCSTLEEARQHRARVAGTMVALPPPEIEA